MRKSAPVKLLWPFSQPRVTNNWRTWELVYPSLWMRFNVWNLFKSSESTGNFQEGWIASPDASRSAERRDTSAMDFEDSLPKSDIRHSPEQAIRHGTAKQNPGRNSQSAAMKPNMCLLQLCRFFVGDFGLQFILWDQFSDNGPHPPVICLSAWGTSMLKKHQKATGPVFWISLPSPCGAPWFPVKRWVKNENNPWLHGPNQNMTKYRIDANTHNPPCTSSRALKRETSEVDFRCSWHTPLLQEDYNHM